VKLSDIPDFVAPRDSSPFVSGDESPLRSEILGDVVASCRARLALKGATLTGLMMACWIQAVSEAAATASGGQDDSVVSISCLVGLHSQLSRGLYTNGCGTVTVSGQGIPRILTEDETQGGARRDRHEHHRQFAAHLVDLASTCTEDMRRRIRRGEAISQGLSLCEGEFESSGCTPGTLELSNHGMYRTTDAISEVAMQQRFDGHDGVSVLMFSESHTGVMRLLANAGITYRREAIEALMERVLELWSVVARDD
jgi:hypothetical protein